MKLNRYLGVVLVGSFMSNPLHALEHSLEGVVDLRYHVTESLDSYLEGGFGKFRYSDGSGASLNQIGVKYQVDWTNWNARVVGNLYPDGEDRKIGVTEAYVQYRGVPDERGIRWQSRIGFMYPKISMENTARAWNSPYTLSWSMQNTWLAQEVRHVGLEARFDYLGKTRGSNHDFSVLMSLFQYNDANGALLSWQGWTMSSRQAFFGEQMPFPRLGPTGSGEFLELQDPDSSPFEELDHNWGAHLAGEWRWRGKLRLLAGYYDNHGGEDIVEGGDYAWQTHFRHVGLDWRLTSNWRLLIQHMSGDTRMRAKDGVDLVDVNFRSSFARLSYQTQKHRTSLRIEDFWNRDLDNMPRDPNNERGDAWTLAYQYQLRRNLLLGAEYNRVESRRAWRGGGRIIEDQWQLGARYFFSL